LKASFGTIGGSYNRPACLNLLQTLDVKCNRKLYTKAEKPVGQEEKNAVTLSSFETYLSF